MLLVLVLAAWATPDRQTATFPPTLVSMKMSRTGRAICDVRLEMRCTAADRWLPWMPGPPCGPERGPEFEIPWMLRWWCADSAAPVWDPFEPPHEYDHERWRYDRSGDVPAWVGQWRIADADGQTRGRFDGIWLRNARSFARHVERLDDWERGKQDPACQPEGGHSCWTVYEMWYWLVREQRLADCPTE